MKVFFKTDLFIKFLHLQTQQNLKVIDDLYSQCLTAKTTSESDTTERVL